jgi:hypothetical protein
VAEPAEPAQSSAATEPTPQHLNLPRQAVRLAHRRERLDGGPHPRSRQRVQGRERQLRLAAREPLLAAQPGMPARHGPIESRRLDVMGERQQLEPVRKGTLGSSAAIVQASMKFRRSSARLNWLWALPLRAHEHMFA